MNESLSYMWNSFIFFLLFFWEKFIADLSVWQNIWSNILVILVGILIAIVFRKRNLLQFFGLSRQKRLSVYFSTLYISPHTAGTHNLQRISFNGPVIPEYEYQIIPFFTELFSPVTISENFFRAIISRLLLGEAKIDYLSSPQTINSVSMHNIISLGGPGSNVITHHYMNAGISWLIFANNNSSVQITKGRSKGKIVGIANQQEDYGILEKIIDTRNNSCVFIAAGVNYSATMGAAYYLARNWRDLQREYGDGEFALCIKVAQPHIDPNGYKFAQVVYKKG